MQQASLGGNLYGVWFLNQTFGYAVGDGGVIYRTLDGGVNWTILNSGVSVVIRNIIIGDLNTAWAVCDGGIILQTIDGGTTWTIIDIGGAPRRTVAPLGQPRCHGWSETSDARERWRAPAQAPHFQATAGCWLCGLVDFALDVPRALARAAEPRSDECHTFGTCAVFWPCTYTHGNGSLHPPL